MSRLSCLLLVLWLSACATSGPDPLLKAGETPRMVWPQAPALTRIEFITLFGSAEDLGLRESFLRRMRDALAGGDNQRLSRPYAIAVSNDKVAIADPGATAVHLFDMKRRTYRKLQAAGKQRFATPIGVALGNDRLFVADSELRRVFILNHRFKPLLTLEGFQRPTSLTFDPNSQRLYVTDTLAHQVRAYDDGGELLFKIGERGMDDEQFNYPSHLAFSGDRLFVNDTMNFRIQIFNSDGRHLKTFGKHGNGSGHLTQPKGLAVDSDGHVYVADALSNRVQIFDQDGVFLLGFGTEGDSPGSFQMPTGLAIWNDRIYVTDSQNQRVQIFRYHGEAQ